MGTCRCRCYPIITMRHEQRVVFTGNRSSCNAHCEGEYPLQPMPSQCNRPNCRRNKRCRGHCFIQRSPPYGHKPPCKCLLKQEAGCYGNFQGQQAAHTSCAPKQNSNKKCNCPSVSQISCTPPVVDFCVPQAKTKKKKQKEKNSKTNGCCLFESPSSIGICCYVPQDKEIKKQNSSITFCCCSSAESSLPEIKECCNKLKERKKKTIKTNCYPPEETSTPPIKVCYPVRKHRIITCGSSFVGRPPILKSASQIVTTPGMNAQIPGPYFNCNRNETKNPPLRPNLNRNRFDMGNVKRSRSRGRRRNVCIKTCVDYDYVPSTSDNKQPNTCKPQRRRAGSISDITHSRPHASNHFVPPDVNRLPPARHPSVNYRQQEVKSDLKSDNGNTTDSRTTNIPHSRRLR